MGPLPEGRANPRYFPFNYSMHPAGADFVRGGQKSTKDTKESENKREETKKIHEGHEVRRRDTKGLVEIREGLATDEKGGSEGYGGKKDNRYSMWCGNYLTRRFHSSLPWLPKLIRTPTGKPVPLR